MKQGRLQNLVAWTQILASLAVIISIFLLINEYRRAEVLNEKDVENVVYDRVMELNRLVIENPDLAAIISLADIRPDSLSATDRLRYLAYEHIFYDSWETMWVGFQDGLIEPETWKDWNTWFLRKAKEKPPLSLAGNRNNFDEAFLIYLKEQRLFE